MIVQVELLILIAGIYEMNMKYAGVWKKQRQHELKMMMTEAEQKRY